MIFDYVKVKDLLVVGLYGINLMIYDFFGMLWVEMLGYYINCKVLEEGGWVVEIIVDYLLVEGFFVDCINIGYVGYICNVCQVEIEFLLLLKGFYNSGLGDIIGFFEFGISEWYDVIYSYLDLENQKGCNGFNVYIDQVVDVDYLYSLEFKLFLFLDMLCIVKVKGEYVVKLGLGGVFIWIIDQDNGVLVNVVCEGLGYEIEFEVIDMELFYFEGINVEKDDEQSDSDDVQKVNYVLKVVIELMVVGGLMVQLFGVGFFDEDNDELFFSWGVFF